MRAIHKRVIALITSLGILMPSTVPLYAANHPYSQIKTPAPSSGPKISEIEFTVSLDWDPDVTPPTVSGEDRQNVVYSNVPLNRAFVDAVLLQTAKSIYGMTAGRHVVKRFYVYKNSAFTNNVDIRILKGEGRSNANVSGFTRSGLTSNNFVIQGKRPSASNSEVQVNFLESTADLGQVIAHEMGHYFYGFYDEYAQGPNDGDPSSPRDSDTAKDTLMHDQYRFSTLSTAGDYADPAARRTAQARVYGQADGTGGSAWEVLTRPKSQDPEQAKQDDGAANRIEFEAFAGLSFPDQTTLRDQTPADSSRPALEIIYLDPQNPLNVILVDTSVSEGQIEKVVEGAMGVVGKIETGNLALFRTTTDGSADGFRIVNFTTNTVVSTDTTNSQKTDILNALRSINPADPPYMAGQADSASLTAAIAAIEARSGGNRLGTADRPDSESAPINSPATITLLVGDNLTVSEAIAKDARLKKIGLNVVRIADGTPAEAAPTAPVAERRTNAVKNLEMIAKVSGGSFNNARSSAEAAKEASRELMADQIGMVLLESDGSDSITTAAPLSTPFRIAKTSVDKSVAVTWYFDPQDSGKLDFFLKNPSGTEIPLNTATPLPSGITVDADLTEGVLEANITNTSDGAKGMWTAIARLKTGQTPTADVVEVEVLSESNTILKVDFLSANASSGPKLVANFMGQNYPIAGGTVTARVFNGDTGAFVRNVTLNDSGTAGDAKPNDGVYVAELTGLLPAGNYFADVVAETTATSTFTTNVTFLRGAPPVAQLTGELSRGESADFQMTGADAAFRPAASGGGGGCTAIGNGNDMSLVLLVLAAAIGGLMRNRRRQQAKAQRMH